MTRIVGIAIVIGLLTIVVAGPGNAQKPSPKPNDEYAITVKPFLAKYCLDCHSTKAMKGSLDLERFVTLDDLRKDLKPWQGMIEQIETGEMPPKKKPQPTAEEKRVLIAWIRNFLDTEAKARIGDPGHVPLRRLSNTEYDFTIRDLTGVNLRPARDFPVDGAAGEGFTNAAEALTDISPTLFTKYLNAAKDIAEHAVLLPDGFRFSPSKTRRDWTDEETAKLRKFYSAHAPAYGRIPYPAYLMATVRHRNALAAGKFDEIAEKEKLNAKYLRSLYTALADQTPSQQLDAVRAKWRAAAEKDVPAVVAEIAAIQALLWKTAKVGCYAQATGARSGGYIESLTRQVGIDPPTVDSVPLRVSVKPASGQSDVVLYLASKEQGDPGTVVWHQPRFEATGKAPLLLRDYADYGPAFEIDPSTAFTGAAKYLAAVVELANDPKASIELLANQKGLDAAFLKQWVNVLAVAPWKSSVSTSSRTSVPLTPLDEKTPENVQKPSINGWKKKGSDLPMVVSNSSDNPQQIPGRILPHGLAMHPTPKEFVAAVWNSPYVGNVLASVRVTHAHPGCGNGVAWWLEHRRGDQATLLDAGALDPGQETRPAGKTLKVEKGDLLVLAVDARDGDHTCDLTEIRFTVAQEGKEDGFWKLPADVASDIQKGNPHADRFGIENIWSFAYGPSRKSSDASLIPANTVLGRWRAAAADPNRKADAERLAKEVESFLTGQRPTKKKDPDTDLYDRLVVNEGPLFAGVNVAKFAKRRAEGISFGLPRDRFTGPKGDSLTSQAGEVLEFRVPAALMVGREFVVDARLNGPAGTRMVQVHAGNTRPTKWENPILASSDNAGFQQLVRGRDEFRRVFPLYVNFPEVVPTDEPVTLKMFHREDEPLIRLFLNDDSARQLDKLWAQLSFVSRQAAAEYDYLPQFMAFTTQDTPKTFQQFFIDNKPRFKKDADAFLAEEETAIPRQLDALLAFAEKAYRRPLQDRERTELLTLYKAIRDKGAVHDEAFRGVLARVLVAPAFLFRLEQAPAGKDPKPVNDWELATRLSYFLWSSMPDAQLRALAAAGKLRDPQVLAGQVERMIRDDRTRALAIEFGTQWIHVRGFEEFNEKNEKLFPTFTPELRAAMAEEAILFFLDLFQNDRTVASILNADHTFLNGALAEHYGIAGVTGPEWRKVDGVRKYGRGGILGFASVQSKQAGASRTSPVLRGNWVVETLLGEKLPRPPPNVPQLPEAEGADKLTMRQQVERHAKDATCATCHVRIDPFGFALEKYDPIGRLREKDMGGLAIDAKAKVRDGSEFEGIDGLRNYLLTKKKDVIDRLFCRRLLGYALGRSVTLSDTALIEEMVAEMNKSNRGVSAAILVIVRSPQFHCVRGSEFEP